MALTFPITKNGLEVDVAVNLEASELMTRWTSGIQPHPLRGRGLIDTGSDITAVSSTLINQLGIPAFAQATTQSIGGGMAVNLYYVGVHILDAGQHLLPWLFNPTLMVMELDTSVPFDVLIGMDIIRTCKMLVDGPAGLFSLEY